MIETIRDWCGRASGVRAAILTGSRAKRRPSVDALSDWDVVLFLDDPAVLTEDPDWFSAFGPVLVSIPAASQELGQYVAARLVQYQDGRRVDFSLFPIDMLRVISILPELPPWLDAGYQVFYDPEGLTGSMVPPFGRGYAGRPPASHEVTADIEEFWWEALVVAKELNRQETVAAAYSAESVMRHGLLRRMLEWKAGVDSGWSKPGGPFGRGLSGNLSDDLIRRARPEISVWEGEAGWAELMRLGNLYAELSRAVLHNIGAEYPDDLENEARRLLGERRSEWPAPEIR
ncbi:MAG: aminoglycoside 6-adenylyltransferase [Gemmatimonadetes bacterium]|jgi:aminoglycoside 6-adenylyltransferase|nr:aminoglycoside 6-adenylyltransferase [Gemmatimonadota bacterium]